MSTMKKRKSQVSKEDVRLTISPPVDGPGRNSGSVPTDLLVETLSRLPAKSALRFRCVSKDWNLLLRQPDFIDLFLKMSASRPRFLLTFQAEGKWSFFSAPQSLISDEQNSLVVVENHTHYVPRGFSFGVCLPVRGLLCSKDEWALSRKREGMVICNPSTGIYKPLPKVRTRRGQVITFVGYEPVRKEFKVLCMTVCEKPNIHQGEEHQVLTIGMGKLNWRMIECSVSHCPNKNGICIDGVLYYLADESETRRTCMVVCFDLRSEKFNFIINKALNDLAYHTTLINYQGKLGAIRPSSDLRNELFTRFDLWVMDNSEEHNWSRHTHILPPLWKDLVPDNTRIYVVGMIGTTEVVFSPWLLKNPFYLFLFNMETNTIKRVEIQGIGPFHGQEIYTFLNHVENLESIM